MVAELENATPAERMEFWLASSTAASVVMPAGRPARCATARPACMSGMTSTWVGMGIGLNEKRTFHLGRAYHLAGRCVGCNECERACPMEIPIGLLNQKLAGEIRGSLWLPRRIDGGPLADRDRPVGRVQGRLI